MVSLFVIVRKVAGGGLGDGATSECQSGRRPH